MKRNSFFTILLCAAVLSISSCGPANRYCDSIDKVAIIAHRGYWDCDEGGHAQNSVASLKAAQDAGFWGSEFDVQMTKDGIVVSNHDKEYGPQKMVIAEHTYDELAQYPLPNGEKLPTLAEYLQQGRKCKTTMLVLEYKTQATDSLTAQLVHSTMQIVKEVGLYDPTRISFISFSRYACDLMATEYPEFSVEFLSFNPFTAIKAPKAAELSYEGLDYNIILFRLHRQHFHELHERGLKANVWTVDKTNPMIDMILLGVDELTTNNPMEARRILGPLEMKLSE